MEKKATVALPFLKQNVKIDTVVYNNFAQFIGTSMILLYDWFIAESSSDQHKTSYADCSINKPKRIW